MAVWKMSNPKNPKKPWAFKINYKDWTGKPKQKKATGFTTKREAQEAEAQFSERVKESADISFSVLVERYLADCKARLKPTTLNNKTFVINTKIVPYFKELNARDIDVAMIRQWQNELISSDENYTPTYLKSIHNQISAIFNYGIKFCGLKNNPAAQCGSMGKKNADEMQFWTLEEFKKFNAAIDDIQAKAIFNLLFYSGMREGELLALTLDDFDFKNNTVKISKTYARVNGKEIIQEPKTPKSKRKITLPRPLVNLIQDYTTHLVEYEPNERLFEITKPKLYRYMEKYCKAAGVKKIRIHDIRHSHASMLINMNIPILLISERLGHENIETTLGTYAHLYPQKHEEVALKLEEYMK